MLCMLVSECKTHSFQTFGLLVHFAWKYLMSYVILEGLRYRNSGLCLSCICFGMLVVLADHLHGLLCSGTDTLRQIAECTLSSQKKYWCDGVTSSQSMEGMSGGVLLIASEEGFDLKQGWKCRRVLVKCSNDPTAMRADCCRIICWFCGFCCRP